jgi:L-threonylcarbamoyladenylate synthase
VQRVRVESDHPSEPAVAHVADALRHGAIAVIPTDTLYGLAVNPFDASAVARLFARKGRRADQAVPLIACSREQVEQVFGELPGVAGRLADTFWPGPLTLLLRAPETLLAVAAGTGRVGVRVPALEVARSLCFAAGMPLTATSANLSGQAPTNNADVAAEEWQATADILLDAGLTPGGPPSTVVDVTGPEPVLIRAGAIVWSEVVECLGRG